jgi:hypothetical protein
MGVVTFAGVEVDAEGLDDVGLDAGVEDALLGGVEVLLELAFGYTPGIKRDVSVSTIRQFTFNDLGEACR